MAEGGANSMNNESFDLFITGQLAAGYARETALQQLAKLFKRPVAEVEKLLNGRPTRIRKNLSPDELNKFQTAFDRIGVITEAIPCLDEVTAIVASSKPISAPKEPENTPQNAIAEHAAQAPLAALSLEPIGSPVLRENERRGVTHREVDTSALSLAQAGSILETPKTIDRPAPATDHLSLSAAGADMQDNYDDRSAVNVERFSGSFSIADKGAKMLEEKYQKPTSATAPDTSFLGLV
ncbi:hypothetical protein IB286_04090 [Spongiibacter sp. KMU-158]|uniref:Uncharacterized protein n=1 Tax=Spongiibacter pelagi TaxID=2760804 RepID=A0A927BYZ9_9GAMM|nr:hypothetical protein [Spongiibacter pelagi]MBD2858178.1 hypothetical protein [Spongiibacter pelagi]